MDRSTWQRQGWKDNGFLLFRNVWHESIDTRELETCWPVRKWKSDLRPLSEQRSLLTTIAIEWVGKPADCYRYLQHQQAEPPFRRDSCWLCIWPTRAETFIEHRMEAWRMAHPERHRPSATCPREQRTATNRSTGRRSEHTISSRARDHYCRSCGASTLLQRPEVGCDVKFGL